MEDTITDSDLNWMMYQPINYLNLSYTHVIDISPLSTLTSLQELYLSNTHVIDISPLSTLTSLQTLGLYNTRVFNISPLSTLIKRGLKVYR